MKFEADIIKEILDSRGHEKSSIHYQSECVEEWVKEVEGAYPKLCDYRPEWLNYSNENKIGVFPYTTLTNVTNATVENVVPYGYKSAILSGQTLVNLIDETRNYKGTVNVYSRIAFSRYELPTNKTYTFIFKNLSDVDIVVYSNEEIFTTNHQITIKVNETKQFIATIKNDLSDVTTDKTTVLKFNPTLGTANLLFECLLLEGDYTNQDIPYFEGMQSVKMPVLTTIGKNLFDESQAPEQLSWGNNVKKANVKENTTYVYSSSPYTGHVSFRVYDNNDNEIGQGISIISGTSFTTPPNTSYLKTHTSNDSLVQIEEGTQATSYEPYKSNILSVNEDIELRGIGEIQDTLNCMTGELTQRIGEITFDGSDDETWRFDTSEPWTNGEYYTFNIHIQTSSIPDYNVNAILTLNNKYPDISYTQGRNDGIGCFLYSGGGQAIAFRQKDIATLEDWKTYLQSNPITVQYRLANESVKTVDLSVVDQNGNEHEQIKPIEGTMHLTTSGESIKPLFSGDIPVEAITQNLASFIYEEE